jgi:hypothetical protein
MPSGALQIAGNRELDDIAELDRTLSELRERVVVELAAGHRVRLV